MTAQQPEDHIKNPYTLAEIKTKIASNDYNAEMLLQHAMLLLDGAAFSANVGEPVAWMGTYDKTDLYYRKPPQADVVPLYTTPQPTKAQAVNQADRPFIVRLAEDFAEECVTAGYVATKAASYRRLMDEALSTQAQAGAVPLTHDEALDAFCRTPGIYQFVQAFMAGVRFAEQHHGITGGQYAAE